MLERRLRVGDLVFAGACAAAIAVTNHGAASEAPVIATAAVRGDAVISSVAIEAMATPRGIDQVLLDLGKKPVQSSRPAVTPRGWRCEPDGGSWSCTGPAVTKAHFSFEPIEVVRWPGNVAIEASGGGAVLLKTKLPLESQPLPEVKTTLENALAAPGRLVPGRPFLVGSLDDRFRDGGWRLQVGSDWIDPLPADRLGEIFAGRLPAELDPKARTGGSRLAFALPDQTTQDTRLRFRYDDPWGATLVDAPYDEWRLEPSPASPCTAQLVACQPKVAIGAPLCVCGCFPEFGDAFFDLELDGRPLLSPPLAASLFTLSVPTADLAPGLHVLTWSGGRGRGRLEFEAVRVAGSIAQDLLMVGESTALQFRVEGTPSVVPMEIALTKGNVSIQGGNTQTVYTSGGALNRIDRTLHAEGVGAFDVKFTIDLPPCPCSGLAEPGDSGEWALHQLSPAGRGVGVFGGLGLRLPLELSSETVIARTPRPPFDPGEEIELDLLQLGLHVESPGLPRMTFESRADARSFGRLRELRLDDEGTPAGGLLDLDLSTEFSMPLDARAPLRVGGTYSVGLEELSLEVGFDFGTPGKYRLLPGDASSAGAELSDIKQDKAGKTLYGSARLRLSGFEFQRF